MTSAGTYPAGSYTGEIFYNGELCQFKTLKDSEEKGIVIIHQELALIQLLTIGENMFLENEKKDKFGRIDWDMTYNEAEKHMKQVGLNESAQTLIKDIGTGKQQLVEIAKAFSKNVKLLILEEPTLSLNDEDAKMLLDLLSNGGRLVLDSKTVSVQDPTFLNIFTAYIKIPGLDNDARILSPLLVGLGTSCRSLRSSLPGARVFCKRLNRNFL